jgi:hypothetical protein
MRKKLNRLIFLATLLVSAAAVAEQLLRPADQRDWHGSVLGIPYDFRRPTLQRFMDAWWNPRDARLFTPRDFGVGWALNLNRLYSLLLSKAEYETDQDQI